MKLVITLVVLEGPLKDRKFSGNSLNDCFRDAHAAGFYSGKIRTQINGITFPLPCCDNPETLVKNKKGAWILAPMKK